MKVSIYRLQNGTFQTSFVDPTGNRRVRAKFQHMTAAQAFKKKLLEQHRSTILTEKSVRPLREFLRPYQEKSPKAAMFTRSPFVLDSFIQTFANMPVGEITKMHLGQWLERIQKERDYAPRTMVLLKYCFTPFFDFLSEVGAITTNPMTQVRMTRYGHRKNERVYLSDPEVREIMDRLRAASPAEVFPIAYFQLHTAAYIGEVVKLRWDQVDLEAGTASFPVTKHTDARVIPLSPQLVQILRNLVGHGDFVFKREDGDAWSVVSYYRRFAKVRTQITVRRTFESGVFRHTFAYHFLRRGGTLAQLQAILGHRSIDMTVFMYGGIADQKTEKTTPYDF